MIRINDLIAILIAVFIATTTGRATLAAELRLAVTTSFHNSGLSDLLLPAIKADLDIDVRLIIVGTGHALKLGRAGDVDALLVHSKSAEEAFVAEGFGLHRRDVMYNDFVFVGPSEDPASVEKSTSASAALIAVSQSQTPFVSRGDDSGTHRKELSLWRSARLDTNTFNPSWYRSVGAGMGATLNTAAAMNAYLLSDRASWLNFGNKGQLKLLYSGDPALFNQYAYLSVSKTKHPHVKADLAAKLEAWLVGFDGQSLIGSYKLNGEALFVPNAH